MSTSAEKFYITTSIAYTNAPPHVGFALELVQADAIARWHGLRGEKRFFLTGTDEHGRKVAKAAEEKKQEPREFVDGISAKFQELAKALDVSNDDFLRTSDAKRHWPGVAKLWKKLDEAGDLYKGTYTGLYCEGCEAFKKPSELVKEKCPDHKKAPQEIREENWFFRLSKYGAELQRIIGNNEIRIVPDTRKNEVLAFIAQGLEDVSFSRPSKDLSWGIPVPGDDTQTIYVWADALVNYLTGLCYGLPRINADQNADQRGSFGIRENPRSNPRESATLFEEFWPADVHLVGKDILRFHAIIWPAMLLSAKLPLPKTILVHGHILSGGQKMSKSLGNVIDPFSLIEKYGVDAVRYFLLKEIPTTGDGDVTKERFEQVYAADLAHTLGNLVSRVTKLGKGKRIVPVPSIQIREEVEQRWKHYRKEFDEFRIDSAVDDALSIARRANEYIEETKPWESEEKKQKTLPELVWMLGNLAWMLAPFLPTMARKIFEQLGIDPGAATSWEEKAIAIRGGDALFPKL